MKKMNLRNGLALLADSIPWGRNRECTRAHDSARPKDQDLRLWGGMYRANCSWR